MSIDVQSRATVVGNLAEFPIGSMKLAKVDGRRLCVIHTSTGIHALDNACPHEGYGLTTGELDGELLTCAWHNWKFRVSDGRCVLGEEDVRTHAVDVADDSTISIRSSSRHPTNCGRSCRRLRRGREGLRRQMSRDVVRLRRRLPGELMWEAVAYGAPHLTSRGRR
jgi:nitrite reductase/ring-hydroxylating ferredoxin subunit